MLLNVPFTTIKLLKHGYLVPWRELLCYHFVGIRWLQVNGCYHWGRYFPFSLEHGLYLGLCQENGWFFGQTSWCLAPNRLSALTGVMPWRPHWELARQLVEPELRMGLSGLITSETLKVLLECHKGWQQLWYDIILQVGSRGTLNQGSSLSGGQVEEEGR